MFSQNCFLKQMAIFHAPPHIWQDMNGPSGLLAQDKIQRRQKGRKSIENKLSFLIRGSSEKEEKNDLIS